MTNSPTEPSPNGAASDRPGSSMQREVSRRDLIKYAAIGASAVGVAGLAGCTSHSKSASSSKTTAAAAATTASGTAVAASGASPAGPGIAAKYKNKTIGVPVFSFADQNEAFFANFVPTAAKEAGLNWKFLVSDCQADQGKAQAAFDSYITQKVDLILDIVVSERLVPAQMARAKQANIPVVGLYAFASPSSPNFVMDYTGVPEGDTVWITGYMINDLLARHPSKTIKLAALDSPLDLISLRRDILKGMLTEAPSIQLVEEQYNVSLTDSVGGATSAVDALLTKYPDLDAIWVNYPPLAVPAASAVAQQGKADQVKVYAHTAQSAGLDALKDPTNALRATSWVDIVYSSYRGVQNCLDVFSGHPASKFSSWLSPVPSTAIDATTYDQTDVVDVGSLGQQRTWMFQHGAYRQSFVDSWATTYAS